MQGHQPPPAHQRPRQTAALAKTALCFSTVSAADGRCVATRLLLSFTITSISLTNCCVCFRFCVVRYRRLLTDMRLISAHVSVSEQARAERPRETQRQSRGMDFFCFSFALLELLHGLMVLMHDWRARATGAGSVRMRVAPPRRTQPRRTEMDLTTTVRLPRRSRDRKRRADHRRINRKV
jgi:hypothetical protein